MTNQLLNLVYILGGVCTFSGIILQFAEWQYAPFVFSAGALLLVFSQVVYSLQSKNDDKRIQRLRRLQFLASLLLVMAAYLMFNNVDLWLIAVLIYGLITVFLAFRDKKPAKQ